MSRVLVLGATGMLGHKMLQQLSAAKLEVLGTVRGGLEELGNVGKFLTELGPIIEGVDALDFTTVEAGLDEAAPDVIVNCVGVVKQLDAAKDHITSITINSLLPHLLHRWAVRNGARLIHFSTDCVFSGSRGGYTEDDTADPVDLYGRSKYLGEVAGDGALTLRTSIIGRQLTGSASLVEWFLSQRGRAIEGYAGAIYTGLTTIEASRIVGELITSHPELDGLFQLASAPISKYDLLVEIGRQMDLDVEIRRNESFVQDRSLIGDRFAHATGIEVSEWPDMIRGMVHDRTPYLEMR